MQTAIIYVYLNMHIYKSKYYLNTPIFVFIYFNKCICIYICICKYGMYAEGNICYELESEFNNYIILFLKCEHPVIAKN